MAKISVVINTGNGVDPFSTFTTQAKGTKMRALSNIALSLAGQQCEPATVLAATANASCTATLATPVAANVLTINGKALTAIQLNARGTTNFDGAAQNDTMVVNDIEFTARTTPTAGSLVQFAVGVSDTVTAQNCAAAINAHPDLAGVVTALGAAGATTTGDLFIRAVDYGTAGNAITTTGTGGINPPAATLLLGAAPSGDQWDYGDTDTQAAASLAACINRSTTALVLYQVTATSALGVVTVRAYNGGLAGNTVAVTKTGNPITLAGVTNNLMTGGTSSAFTF